MDIQDVFASRVINGGKCDHSLCNLDANSHRKLSKMLLHTEYRLKNMVNLYLFFGLILKVVNQTANYFQAINFIVKYGGFRPRILNSVVKLQVTFYNCNNITVVAKISVGLSAKLMA